MKILMVMTSNDEMGASDFKTGIWLEEFTAPYYTFVDAGATVTLASPAGGQPPIDPNSQTEDALTDTTERFENDNVAKELFANTKKLSEINTRDYDAVFYPGGHGPLWDLVTDQDSIRIIAEFYDSARPVGFVCHAPAVLKNVKRSDGLPLVYGKRVTGFSRSEEDANGLTVVVPFMIEDMVQENGGVYSRSDKDFAPFSVVDGQLITGQNPASSNETAERLLKYLSDSTLAA